jgi:hypothetical protein
MGFPCRAGLYWASYLPIYSLQILTGFGHEVEKFEIYFYDVKKIRCKAIQEEISSTFPVGL